MRKEDVTGERLIALRVYDPAAWQARVQAVLREQRSRHRAAQVLGVSVDYVRRWVAQVPALGEGVAWRGPGRPKQLA